MESATSAPGKIILCGEYAVVFGYPGIALPSSLRVETHFAESDRSDFQVHWEDQHEEQWGTYVRKIIELCQKKKKIPNGTLTITNHLPLGRGMGSSTAFVIAIASCLLGKESIEDIQAMEDELSPGNSGLDFAVIWDETPLLFSKDEGTEEMELPAHLLDGALLIDTGIPNETTSELVAWVSEQKGKNPEIEDALKTIGHCADRLLNNEKLITIFQDHHRAQVRLGVVPVTVQRLILEIEELGGAAKVIGAGGRSGGGGMVLAVGIDAEQIPTDHPVTPL